jgi:phosphatidylserine/phosphatidylglycerophosphate/cardiolipin synthase-like enzyme
MSRRLQFSRFAAIVAIALLALPAEARPKTVSREALGVAGKLARRKVTEPRLQAESQRWGVFTQIGARRRARAEAETEIRRFVDQARASGRLDEPAARRLQNRMRARLDRTTVGAAGGRRWWSTLHRVTDSPSRSFSRLDLIVDGPEFRRAVHDLVGRSRGFLHISGLEWANDTEGRAMAESIIARKLAMQPEALREQLRTRTLGEVRDARLAEAMGGPVDRFSEAERVALVDRVIEPLEVRVLVSGMFQFKANRGRLKPEHLRELEKVGVQVLLEHLPFQRRFPFFKPHNLYARVTHGKMVVSGDEAVAGGQNYGTKYMQPAGQPLIWHDAGTAIEGELVHGYTKSFIGHWNRTAREQGHGRLVINERVRRPATDEPLYFPRARGPPRGQATIAGTDEQIDTTKARYTYRTALKIALAGAQESVVLTNPYFTSPLIASELAATARRFIREGRDPSKIVLILTKATDEALTGALLNNHYIHRLKRLGVTVVEFAPDPKTSGYTEGAINHAKAWMVDGKVAYVGSANLTVRSMTQDWEMGVISDEPRFVAQVRDRLLSADLKNSTPVKSLSAPLRYLGYGLSLILGPLLRAT